MFWSIDFLQHVKGRSQTDITSDTVTKTFECLHTCIVHVYKSLCLAGPPAPLLFKSAYSIPYVSYCKRHTPTVAQLIAPLVIRMCTHILCSPIRSSLRKGAFEILQDITPAPAVKRGSSIPALVLGETFSNDTAFSSKLI